MTSGKGKGFANGGDRERRCAFTRRDHPIQHGRGGKKKKRFSAGKRKNLGGKRKDLRRPKEQFRAREGASFLRQRKRKDFGLILLLTRLQKKKTKKKEKKKKKNTKKKIGMLRGKKVFIDL